MDINLLDCGERLSIDQAIQLQQQWLDALRLPGSVQVQGGAVQFCDTAGMQLLLALQKTLQQSGQSLCWHSVSPVLRQTAAHLGLQHMLQLN